MGTTETHPPPVPEQDAVDAPCASDSMLRELQAHNIELATQNETLRRSHRALEKSRDRYFSLYEFSPFAYLALTDSGSIADINLTGTMLLGAERGNLLNRCFADFVAAGDGERWQHFFVSVQTRQDDRLSGELALRSADGRHLHARVDGICLTTDDGAPRLRFALSDISERREAELGLQAVTRLYELLRRANRAIVRIRDLDELLEKICRIAVEDGGFVMVWAGHVAAGEVVPYAHWGREDGYLEQARIVIRDRVLGNGPTGKAILEGRPFVCDDIATDPRMEPWRDLALARGYASSAAFPVSVGGEVVGSINLYAPSAHFFTPDLVGLLADLTEDVSFAMNAHAEAVRRRAAEADVCRLNEHLELRVRERTQELEAANRELEAFSYSVSHDLRAPLRSIDGFSQVLLKRYADKLDDTARDYLGRVRRASQRMGQLIDDLMHLSRVTRGTLRRQEVDLSAMAQALLDELRRARPERKVHSHVQEGMRAFGDPGLLHVMLDNLLGNAWKFSRNEDVAEIEFACREVDDELVYCVRDNGAGFDSQYAGKLFQVFQRLHSEAEFEGTGIGLATVHRVVQRHRGEVWAKGEPGQGASFFFTLPRRKKERELDAGLDVVSRGDENKSELNG